MNDDQGNPVDESTIEPRPMKAKPFLQVLSWVGGVAAGGVFIALLSISPSRVHGATRAMKLRWIERSPDAKLQATVPSEAPAQEEKRAGATGPATSPSPDAM